MQSFGTVVSVENDVQVAKNGGGTYPGTRFAYRDETGTLREKGIHNNAFKFNKTLKQQLSNLAVGQKFVMESEKQGEFWNILSVLPATEGQQVNKVEQIKPTASPKSTYETPEERAKKQVYIVRQSAITAALSFLNNKAKTVEEVTTVAKQFVDFVMGNIDFNEKIEDMKNDTDGIV